MYTPSGTLLVEEVLLGVDDRDGTVVAEDDTVFPLAMSGEKIYYVIH